MDSQREGKKRERNKNKRQFFKAESERETEKEKTNKDSGRLRHKVGMCLIQKKER